MTDYDWPDDLTPYQVSFYLQPHTGGSESPFSRKTKVYGLSAPRWVCSLSFRGGYWGDPNDAGLESVAPRLDSFVARLKGRQNRVSLWDFRRDGTSLGTYTNNAIAAGATTVTLVGAAADPLPLGYYIGGDGRPHIVTDSEIVGSDQIVSVQPPFSADVVSGGATFEQVAGSFRLVNDDAGANGVEVGEASVYSLDFVEDSGVDVIVALFGAGESGGYWDFTDESGLFQDTTAATPVTATGQPIRLVYDKRTGRPLSSGNSLTAPSDARRPKWLVDSSGYAWAEFDGVDDSLRLASLDMTGDALTYIVVMRAIDEPQLGIVASWGYNPSGGTGAVQANINNIGNGSIGLGMGASGNYRFGNEATNSTIPRTTVTFLEALPARPMASNMDSYVDGAAGDMETLYVSGAAVQAGTVSPTILNAARQLDVGANAADTGFAKMGLVALAMINRRLTTVEKANISSFFSGKAGITPAPTTTSTHTPTAFRETGAATNIGTYYKTSVFARVIYDTSATYIRVTAFSDMTLRDESASEVGVIVDGSHYGTLNFVKNGLSTQGMYLPAGAKRIEFVNGQQSNPGSVQGTFLVSVAANATLTFVSSPSITNRMLVYGDSIAVGGNSEPPVKHAWPLQLRRFALSAGTYDSLGVEAWGYRSLYEDASDSTKRAAFVAKVVAWNPTKLWMAIGTNDYGLNLWTAANFQTALDTLFSDLHTALPSLQIYAQTPLSRTTETANGLGSTLGNYRTAISSAASGKAYVTVVDGTTLLTTADLADGLHPTTAGHKLLANAIRTYLGIAAYGDIRAVANVTVTDLGSNQYQVTKAGGGAAFNGAARGDFLTGDFTIQIDADQTNGDALIGVSEDPITDNGVNIDYAIYLTSAGTLFVYEDGSQIIGPSGTYTTSTHQWIGRRGSQLTYRQGATFDAATILRTVNGATMPLAVDTSLYTDTKTFKIKLS